MERNIGIFIAISSGHLRMNEGIVQLLCHLISSKEFRNRIVIAMPSWSHDQFDKLLKEVPHIEKSEIEFIYTKRRKSLLIKITEILSLTYRHHYKPKKKFILCKAILHKIYDSFINIAAKNLFCFLISTAPLFLIYLLYMISKKIINKFIVKILNKTKIKLKELIKRLFSSRKILQFINKVKERAEENEYIRIIKKINNRKEIRVWYVPVGNWPMAKRINANKIFSITDIVYIDFPFQFYATECEIAYEKIRKTLNSNSKFICNSEHVKTKHLQSHQIKEVNISIIKHGFNDLSPHLSNTGSNMTDAAIKVLTKYQSEILKNDAYLCDFHLPSMKFIFYASQIRPHKNILNLIKAYEYLLRRKFINIKLVITGNPKHDIDIYNYIQKNRLQYDIISLHEISQEVKAAFNHLAICAINPSLFEGGFPFTFCEAYSVGTPSIMSRIKVVLEESTDETINSYMLFNPHSVEDIILKTEWVINNKKSLYEKQKPLFEKLSKQSWERSAKEHLDLFDNLIQSNSK